MSSDRCDTCRGSGDCHECDGEGTLRGKRCAECGGDGACSSCDGTGSDVDARANLRGRS